MDKLVVEFPKHGGNSVELGVLASFIFRMSASSRRQAAIRRRSSRN